MKLFLDTETGGTNEQIHSLLTVGMALVNDDFSTKAEFYGHLDLDSYNVTKKALELNKIDLVNIGNEGYGYSKLEMINTIKQFLINNKAELPITVIGHNVDFDLRFLRKLFIDCEIDNEFYNIFSYRKIDTSTLLQTVSILKPKCNISSLDSAIKFFNVEFDKNKRHNALEDVKVTIQIYKNLLEMIVIK